MSLGEAGARAIDDGATELIIDLSEFTFVDSSGLAALIAIRNAALASGASLTLQSPAQR